MWSYTEILCYACSNFILFPTNTLIWIQSKHYFSEALVRQQIATILHEFNQSVERKKQNKTSRTKFSCIGINLIFPPLPAPGKPPINLKKANRSIYTLGKFHLYCNLIFFPKITSQTKWNWLDQGPPTLYCMIVMYGDVE